MRTKHLKYLLSVLAAIYFVLAGTGYNIVQYCCYDCAIEGIDFITQHSCAAVHLEQHHDCCNLHDGKTAEVDHKAHIQTCAHDNSCQVIRVQLDDFAVVDKIFIKNLTFNNLFIEKNVVNDLSGHLIASLVLNEYSHLPIS